MTIVTGKVIAGLVAIPPRFTRDLAERRRLDGLINEMRDDVSKWLIAEVTGLKRRRASRRGGGCER